MIERFCQQPDCFADTGCVFGEVDPSNCPHRVADTNDPQQPDSYSNRGTVAWNGSPFGAADIQLLSATARPALVAILGPHNAGKTTFLTAFYLNQFRGMTIPQHSFAGSYTLKGWESLAESLRYPNRNRTSLPSFPRHTPVTKDRVPGLLHISYRRSCGSLRDILFTDAPGEWFSTWAKNANDDSALGARWVVKHADRFVFFIDSQELRGDARGEARHHITLLAQRLADARGKRAVILLWSKSDLEVDVDTKRSIDAVMNRHFPNAPLFAFTVKASPEESQSTLRDIGLAMYANEDEKAVVLPPLPRSASADPFLAYRYTTRSS
ncbi:MAG TPA: hypothetical protein VHC22_01860 [Pirellulales bacterium]|nr:hypothetical protein [Pirellulales bacterium]